MHKYYAILGLTYPTSKEQIKKAFYRLAHIHHPDKKTGNEQKFKEINEAYQILMKQDAQPISDFDAFEGIIFRQRAPNFHYADTRGYHVDVSFDPETNTMYTIRW